MIAYIHINIYIYALTHMQTYICVHTHARGEVVTDFLSYVDFLYYLMILCYDLMF